MTITHIPDTERELRVEIKELLLAAAKQAETIAKQDAALRRALEWIKSNPAPRRLGALNAIIQIERALK
jgi:hypothetical protein